MSEMKPTIKELPQMSDAQRLTSYLDHYGPGRLLDPARLMEIRLRIAGGFYNRRGVLLTTASRLLNSGDLKPPNSRSA